VRGRGWLLSLRTRQPPGTFFRGFRSSSALLTFIQRTSFVRIDLFFPVIAPLLVVVDTWSSVFPFPFPYSRFLTTFPSTFLFDNGRKVKLGGGCRYVPTPYFQSFPQSSRSLSRSDSMSLIFFPMICIRFQTVSWKGLIEAIVFKTPLLGPSNRNMESSCPLP